MITTDTPVTEYKTKFFTDPDEERFNELMTEANWELLKKLPNSRPRLVIDNTVATEVAVDFLEKLRPGGPWVLTAIEPDGLTDTITAKNAEDVQEFVRKNDGKNNLYFSVNPTRTALRSKAFKARYRRHRVFFR
jgi:hypothetical protein